MAPEIEPNGPSIRRGMAPTRRGNNEKSYEKPYEQGDDVVERVLDRIVDSRIGDREVRNAGAYRRGIRERLDAEVDVARLRRIIAEHPEAPPEMLAAAALGEPTPYLAQYRTTDGALTA